MARSLQNHLRFALALLSTHLIVTSIFHSLRVTVDENEDNLNPTILPSVLENRSHWNFTENENKVENEEERPDQKSWTIQNKPWLVLHVGPPKTGTTTIQDAFIEHASRLASTDSVFYMGQPVNGKYKYFQYQQNKSNVDNKGSSIAFSTRAGYLGDDDLYVATMKWHLQQKHNVVCSHESLTWWINAETSKFDYFNVYSRVFLQEGGMVDRVQALKPNSIDGTSKKYHEGYKRQQNIAKGNQSHAEERKETKEEMDYRISHAFHHDDSSTFGFDVKIVVTYRHYFQWLPSYYYQFHLISNIGEFLPFSDYVNEALDGISKEYHVEEPMIDFTNSTWLHEGHDRLQQTHGTLFSYLKWSAPRSLRDRVEIFDMHQQQIIPATDADQNKTNDDNVKRDLFRDFVCQALPNAASTCSEMQDKSAINDLNSRNEKGQGSALETGKLSSTQLKQLIRKAKDWFPQLKAGTKEGLTSPIQTTSPFQTFENITWEDSIFHTEKKWINFQRAEWSVRKNFESWTKQRAKRENNDNHRQLCLGEETTRKLRNVSWNMLRHLAALARLTTQSAGSLFKAPDVARPNYPLLLSPNKYDHPSSSKSENADWWGPTKRAHDDLFQKTIESGAYCELDLDRLFADKEFIMQVFFKK